MNSVQLSAARQACWSQDGEARLTLEAAKEWLDEIGFCAYLPTAAGAPVFASFVEAVVGRPARIPSAGERGRAAEILSRLIESSVAAPLKFSTGPAEHPDFILSGDALAYIYALRGNRNPKAAPQVAGNDNVTPLALHSWQALQQHGPLTVAGLQQILGQDVTQPAILRALHELWSGLYAFPTSAATTIPAQWELFARRFPKQVAAGSNMGHAEAQSAIVSLYLHAAVAAPEDEVLMALAPFTSQSKLREVLRGLGSMRQLDIVDIEGHAHVCLQGGLLPETVARLSEEQLPVVETEPDATPAHQTGEKLALRKATFQLEATGTDGQFTPKKFAPRKPEFRQAATKVEPNLRGRSDRHQLQSSTFDRQRPRAPRDKEFRAGETKPWQQRKSYAGGAGPVRGERGQPRRQDGGWSAPKFRRRDGEDPQESRRKPTQTGHDRPWRSQRDTSMLRERTDRPPKPSQRTNFRDFRSTGFSDHDRPSRSPSRGRQGTEDESRRPSRNTGERREFSRGGTSSDRKPWKNRPAGQKSSGFARPGFVSRRPERDDNSSGEQRFSLSKPWQNRQRPENEDRGGRANGEPTRRGKSFVSEKPAGKRSGKPFWAKPARGGKGSSNARRNNRSGGKSPGQKKGGKRK